MCQRIVCPRCGKASWAGCGKHVEQVLAGVPPEKRCSCPREEPGPSFLQRILGSRKG